MSSTDTAAGSGPAPSTPPPASAASPDDRKLRRSRDGRVGAGVAAGLGDYFGLDPVLFRVLFATSAFFGGAGIIAYLIAWAAIPEEGAEHSPVDDWITRLRRRNVPPWLLAVGAGLVLWALAFSWWGPGPFVPLLAVVVLLFVVYGRRGANKPIPADPATPPTAGVDLTKSPAPDSARTWFAQSRAAARERRRRAFPIRIGTLVVLAAALVVLGIVDAVDGVALPLYFVFVGAAAVAGLLVGLVLRRTPWSLAGLLIPAVIGLIAFGGTSARLHDGVGRRTWDPTSQPASSYRLALGRATLDLRDLPTQDRPRTVHVTMAAGRVMIVAPKSLDLTVEADVHLGAVTVDGNDDRDDRGSNLRRTTRAPKGATGEPLTVIVRLASGRVDVDRR